MGGPRPGCCWRDGQAVASYTPQPGYAGPDHFTVTLEPHDRAVSVDVTVQPGGS